MEAVLSQKRGSLVIAHGRHEQRLPCLILDSSKFGYRVRGTSQLKRGQAVELIFGEQTSLDAVDCTVMWVGKSGSEQEGEAGLQILIA